MRGYRRTFQTIASSTKLEDVVRLDLLAKNDAKGVARIWNSRHAQEEAKGRFGTHMNVGSYERFVELVKEAPLFVFPMAKPEGYLSVVSQVQLPRILFTTLEEFRTHASASRAHLSVTHYTELAHSKGLVLVRGDVLRNSDINVFEGKALLQQMYDFYLTPRKYHTFVKKFNQQPNSFQFKDLLVELGFWK